MRTEMVIRMQGGSEKKGHAKAMKVAAAVEGVESVTLSGKDKSLLRVVGDGVDCNHLTTRLRRKVGRADLVELHTLYGSSGGYAYSRTTGGGGGLLSRDAAAAYDGGAGSYGAGYTAAASSYAADYYGGQQPPPFQYYHHAATPYAAPAAAAQHEYYTTDTDPSGCSVM